MSLPISAAKAPEPARRIDPGPQRWRRTEGAERAVGLNGGGRARRFLRETAGGGVAGQLATRTLVTSAMSSLCSAEGWAWTSPEIWPPHSISIWP
jgi:hypothetical protein